MTSRQPPLPLGAAQAALKVLEQRQLLGGIDLQRLQTLASSLSAVDHKLAVTEAIPLLFSADKSPANAETSLRKLVMRLGDVQADANIPEVLRFQLEVQRKNQALSHQLWFTGPVGTVANARTPDRDGTPILLEQSAVHEPVLLLTVNDNETAALRNVFSCLGAPEVFEHDGSPYELLGHVKQRPIIAFRCQMGSSRVGAALSRTLKAIQHHKPWVVIAVGIAFGRNDGKQQLGDVLLSSQVQTYESERLSDDGSHTWRGEKVPAASRWLERCTQHPPIGFKLHKGLLVCGEKLLDNAKFREQLNVEFPTNVGGDMESSGLVGACHDEKVDWVVVKGVSDWGDGTKSSGTADDKQALQLRAATHAAQVVYSALFLVAAPAYSIKATAQKAGEKSDFSATAHTIDLNEVRDFIEQLPGAHSMASADAPERQTSTTVREDLLLWLKDDTAPPIFALLGEYGMGKTINCQRLYRDLRELRQLPNPPAWAREPLYFDLRKLSLFANHDRKGVLPLPKPEELINDLIDHCWTTAPGLALPRYADVQTLLAQGALLIIDGLDECLVHLTDAQHPLFVSTVFNLLTDAQNTAQGTNAASTPRLLVSCRTNFFKTLADQRSLFTGQHRGQVGADWYRSLVLTPLTDAQIAQYLKAVLPQLDSARVLDLIATTHNLPELAQRPMTLKLLSEHIAGLEALRQQGHTVNGAALYSLVATKWLERDFGKHHLEPEYKLRLMAALAAHLWRSKVRTLRYEALRTWFHQWRASQSDLAERYAPAAYNQTKLEEDLRTATFVVRQDADGGQAEGFRFAHSSLNEFFLARYLADAVADNQPDAWAMPIPSQETLHFLAELLALDQQRLQLEQPEAPTLQATLNAWRTSYRPQASELLLKYALNGSPADTAPRPMLAGFVLTGAQLSGWVFGQPLQAKGQPLLPMQACDFSGANLRRAQFHHVRLDGSRFDAAVLDLAAFQHGSAMGTQWQHASLVGTVFRQSDLRDANWEPSGERYGTQLVACTNDPHMESKALRWKTPVSPHMAAKEQLTHLEGHGSWVTGVAMSSDGTRIVSGSGDNTVRIWDAATGGLLLTLVGHTDWITSVAISSDGTRIASGSGDKTVRLWDTATGALLSTLTGHGEWVTSVAISSDGMVIAAGSGDKTIRLWDTATGTPLRKLSGCAAWVRCVDISSDCMRIAAGSDDNTVRLWDAVTGELLHTLNGHGDWVNSVAFSGDGTCIVSGSGDGTVRLWDAAKGALLHNLCGSSRSVIGVTISSDGRRIASGSDDKTVLLWDAATGALLHTLNGHSGLVRSVAISSDGMRIASGSTDETVRLWDAATGELLHTLSRHRDSVNSVAISNDGKRIASGSRDKTIWLWNAVTGALLHKLSGHGDQISSVAISRDGTRIASGSDDKTVRLWEAATGAPLHTLVGHSERVSSVALSSDGTRIASGADDKTVRLWETATGALLHTLRGHDHQVTVVNFSVDSSYLAVGYEDGAVQLWVTEKWRMLRKLTGSQIRVTALAFSDDSKHIAVGAIDQTLHVWDLQTGKRTALKHVESGTWTTRLGKFASDLSNRLFHFAPERRERAYITSTRFSADGTRLASCLSDQTIRHWDMATGKVTGKILGSGDHASCSTFSNDGFYVILGTKNTLRLSDAATGQLMRVHWAGTLGTVPSHATWRPPATSNELPEATSDVKDGGALLSASGDAWRMFAWRVWDDPRAPGQWNQLPLDVYD